MHALPKMEGGTSADHNLLMAIKNSGELDGFDFDAEVELPPGFRFHPTDEEIIIHYLVKKVVDRRFAAIAIGEADFNKCEPWDLPKKAKMGEKEWFLFCQRDRKYPTGMRTNRATESGYWKATGKDKEIYKGRTNSLIGMKKTLVFYKGRAPKGVKTNWVMHEYRLEGNFSNYTFSRAAKEEWVVCKVFHKNSGTKPERTDSFMDHLLDSPAELPPLTDYSYPNNNQKPSSTMAIDHGEEFKGNSSSSRLILNNQHDQKSFLNSPYNNHTTPNNRDPHPVFFSQITTPNPLAFPYQASSLISPSLGYNINQDLGTGLNSSYPTNYFPFKSAAADQENLRLLASNYKGIAKHETIMCKVEHFSSNNSVVSHSQETGLSTEVANEITSVVSKRDTESMSAPFDQQLEAGPSFSPNISDLDSLWSY